MEKEKYMIMNGMMCRWWNMTILGMMENLKMANMMVKERCILIRRLQSIKVRLKTGNIMEKVFYMIEKVMYFTKANLRMVK
ncbi:hypothetical protein C804_00625 [Lachnospiraceae bacterium A4]|nr:hypothetical protein C804_00625 [Lachnospiraceae bacterium A4]